MAGNRLFLNGALLDRWVTSGIAELGDGVLIVRSSGDHLALEEAVRILREATGAGDPHGLVGFVRPVPDLVRLGAEILDRSLVLGDRAYDVDPGFLAVPLGEGRSVAQGPVVARLTELLATGSHGESDEELLARYLIQRLE